MPEGRGGAGDGGRLPLARQWIGAGARLRGAACSTPAGRDSPGSRPLPAPAGSRGVLQEREARAASAFASTSGGFPAAGDENSAHSLAASVPILPHPLAGPVSQRVVPAPVRTGAALRAFPVPRGAGPSLPVRIRYSTVASMPVLHLLESLAQFRETGAHSAP